MSNRLVEGAARAWGRIVRVKTLQVGERLWSGPGPTVRERDLFGQRMPLDLSRSNTHRMLYLEGDRFISEARLVRTLVFSGMAVIDVGANIGYYLLLVKSAGAGRVVCIEPEDANLVELRRTVAANRFEDVDVIAAAAGAEPGTVNLNTSTLNAVVDPAGDDTVVQVTVDSCAPERTGFLKIDVEGYEWHVLQGAQETIERWRPNLLVELHPAWRPDTGHIACVVDEISDIYPRVEMLRVAREEGPRRVVNRFRAPQLVPVESWTAKDEPFWLIARSST